MESTLTPEPEIQATRNTSYITASKSLNGRKIARMAPFLTIFGPKSSQRRDLFFENFSNERRRHGGIVVVVVVVIVAVVAVIVVIRRFGVASISEPSLAPFSSVPRRRKGGSNDDDVTTKTAITMPTETNKMRKQCKTVRNC